MMTLEGYITELTLIGIYDPGVANEERVVLRPTEQVRLANFALVAAVASGSHTAHPIHDHVFWFPDELIQPPSWILVYTGVGEQGWQVLNDGSTGLVLYWQRPQTLFTHALIVPVLLRFDAAIVGGTFPHVSAIGAQSG